MVERVHRVVEEFGGSRWEDALDAQTFASPAIRSPTHALVPRRRIDNNNLNTILEAASFPRRKTHSTPIPKRRLNAA